MNNNQAGKGDKQRPTNKTQFDKNFEKIEWKKPDNKDVAKKGKTSYKY